MNFIEHGCQHACTRKNGIDSKSCPKSELGDLTIAKHAYGCGQMHLFVCLQ